jgi:lysophospholipase L1-like esterase
MISPPRLSAILLLFCLTLLADAALGQSLSITRNGESNVWINAAAPPDTPCVLQESANLHLWVDINESVLGQTSNHLDSAGATERFFRLIPWTPLAPPITVVLIGDSTVADFANDNGWFNGWGQGIYGLFKTNVQVVNLAFPLFSTKIFLASDQYAEMQTIKPDYVLMQFGLIDAFGYDGNLTDYATSLQEYSDNLKTIIRTIRGFGGTPVLITPPVLMVFDASGQVVPTMPDRTAVVKDVAVEFQIPLIDLNQMSIDLFNKLGESGSAYIAWTDKIHFTQAGAQVIAGLVANALPDSFGPYLIGIFNPPPKP